MRRKDREIIDKKIIEEIIFKSQIIRLGFIDEQEVYIVPLNYGVRFNEQITFYFHSASVGRKIDCIKKNPYVGFEVDTNFKINEGEIACEYSARFQSVIGNGKIEFIEEYHEKEEALNIIMEHYTESSSWKYNKDMIERVCVFKLVVEKCSCKEHK